MCGRRSQLCSQSLGCLSQLACSQLVVHSHVVMLRLLSVLCALCCCQGRLQLAPLQQEPQYLLPPAP